MVGQRIGNYEIVQPLGEGGMATVYVALHPELRRRVAVKVLHADLARSAEMVQRFFNEARAASGIGHRGIVEVSDLGMLDSGEPYLVMELLEGESLASRMSRQGPFPLWEATEIAAQAADVMVAAHARGIVHRDLKPENLYLIPDPLLPGRELVKVLDFGIAKLAQRPPEREGLRTRTGAILGTPRYMSPEQCRDSRDVDHRADLYSLGIVLYEMLAGAPPFVSTSWGELAHMHLGVAPPSLRSRAAETPVAVAEIVHRTLEKDPAARFQSMAEFKSALVAATAAPTAVSPSVRSLEVGSTQRFEAPVGRPRPTTLEEAAVEVQHDQKPRHAAPRLGAVSLAVGAAVLVVVGWLALRPPATTYTPMATPPVEPPEPPPEPVESPPVAPPPVVAAPPAALPEPVPAAPARTPAPAEDDSVPGAPPDRATAGAAPEGAPAEAAPPRRRRRSHVSPKPAAPAKPAPPALGPAKRSGPREPLKV